MDKIVNVGGEAYVMPNSPERKPSTKNLVATHLIDNGRILSSFTDDYIIIRCYENGDNKNFQPIEVKLSKEYFLILLESNDARSPEQTVPHSER